MNNQTRKYHYVYQITELSTGKKYIGVRSSVLYPFDDLGIHYFSSSKDKEFIKNQKENPSDYKYEVLSEYNNRKDAIKEEIRLHELYDIAINENFINRAKSTSCGFDTTGKVLIRNDYGDIELINKTDDRYINGEIHYHCANKIKVYDNNGNKLIVYNDDPRIESGELSIGILCRNVKNNEYIRCHISDPRIKSGEVYIIKKYNSRKKCIIDGTVYNSILDAAIELNISYNAVKQRIYSKNYKNYEYV